MKSEDDGVAVLVAEINTQFWSPKSVAVDGAGNVYTGCYGWRGGLEMFRPTRSGAATLEAAWTVETGRVRGVAILPDGSLAASVRHAQGAGLQNYGPDGARRTTWPALHAAQSPIANPTGLAADPLGGVYVTETTAWDSQVLRADNRVHKLGPDGRHASSWGGSGSRDGELNLPTGVAVGPDGTVYVADTFNSRIQAFSPTGAFLRTWGAFGQGPAEFNCPQGIAVSPDGTVYVTDTGNNRVIVFRPDGTRVASWGRRGSKPGEFWLPCGVALDARGQVFVADTMNNRIQIFQCRAEGA